MAASRAIPSSLADTQAPATKAAEMSAVGSFKLPGTLVAPPFLRSIRQSPVEGVKLQMGRVRSKVVDAIRIAGTYISSKPSMFSGARLKVDRASIVPAAKELHHSLSEAFAAGDLATLRRVCFPVLYHKLSSQVTQRPGGIRKQWDLVAYTRRWSHPRIVDHKLMSLPNRDGTNVTAHQAVVAIRSRQRLTQFNEKTGKSTGPPKEMEVTENLIIIREINPTTYSTTDWRVFGYVDETTYKDFEQDKKDLEVLMGMGQP